MDLCGFGGAVGSGPLAGKQAVLAAHKHHCPAHALLAHHAEALAGHQEVACQQNVDVALPHRQRRFLNGGPARDARVVDQHIQPAVGQHGLAQGVLHGAFAGDIAVHEDCAACAELFVDLVGGSFAVGGVDVGDDDVTAFLGQLPGGGAANAAGRPGDEGYLAGKIAVRGAQLQLIQLQRPVFDVVGFLFRQAVEAAQGLSAAQHLHRPVVKLAAHVGVGHIAPGVHHAHARDEDDAGRGVAHFVARFLAALKVIGVALFVLGDAALQRLLQRFHALGRFPGGVEGLALHVYQVVGAGGPALAHLWGVGAADHIQHFVALVCLEDGAAASADSAANDGQHFRQDGFALGVGQGRNLQVAKHPPALAAVGDVILSFLDDADAVVVHLAAGLAPGDQAVLAHDDALNAWVFPHFLANPLAEGEARANVGHVGHAAAIYPARFAFRVRGAHEADHGVWVGMIDVGEGDEGVQQRLDALARASWFQAGAVQVGDHFLVGHGVARPQRVYFVQLQDGEAFFNNGGDVAA